MLLCTPATSLAQSVVPDGNTATGVTISSTGLTTVEIAPADAASVSYNSFTQFSVPTAGVALNNSTANASTIVNEVTSQSPTTIEGPLTIIGQEADLIIANPNGISVNGGRFEGRGNVALTTGTIETSTSGGVAARMSGGTVSVGPAGLSGTMRELALASKAFRLVGSIDLDTKDGNGHANFLFGSGVIRFDRDRNGLGQDGLGILPWAELSEIQRDDVTALSVDIAPGSSVGAGRISVTVTDRGAGVRVADASLASAGEFRLTNSGRLEITGSTVSAEGALAVEGSSVSLGSSANHQTQVSSQSRGVTIRSTDGDVDLKDASIAGVEQSAAVFNSESGQVEQRSRGGVTVLSSGDITAASSVEFASELKSQQESENRATTSSNVSLNASGQIDLTGTVVTTTDNFRIEAGSLTRLSHVYGALGKDLNLLSNAAMSFDAVVINAERDVKLTGRELRFGSTDSDQERTELIATNGGFTLRSTVGNIFNYGSLLEGRRASTSDLESLSGLTLYAAGSFVNESLSVARLAVAFGRDEGLFVDAGGDVRNLTGRLFSNGGITVNAGGDIENTTKFTVAEEILDIERLKGSRFLESLFLKRRSYTNVSADFGERAISGEQSFILGVGDVTLNAKNVVSSGADITGANVVITASEVFENEARRVGTLSFRQKCKWLCKTSGHSNVSFVGGTVTASQTLSIDAKQEVINRAGTLTGAFGLVVDSPLTTIVPVYTPSLVEHPSGVTGRFMGRRGRLVPTFSFGSLRSTIGTITINGDADLGSTNILSLGEIEVTGTQIETTLPEAPIEFSRRPLGLFWGLFE